MLKPADFFVLLRTFKKLGIREEVKKLITDVTGKSEKEIEKIQTEKGADVVLLILENLDKAEEEIFLLIASYKDKTVEEIKELPIEEFTNCLFELIGSKQFRGFFGSAVQSMM